MVAARRASRSSGLPAVEVHLSDVEHARGVPARVGARGRLRGDGQRARASTATATALRGLEGGACEPRRTASPGAASERRRAARHRPRQRALPDRASRARTASPSSGRDLRRFITDFRYVEQAGVARSTDFDRELAPQDFLAALSDGWPDGAVRLGFEDDHVSVAAHARLRELLPDRRRARARRRGVVEAVRAVKEPGEIARIRRGGRARRRRSTTGCSSAASSGAPSARSRVALEHEMRLRGAEAPELPVDRRLGRARRAPARARRATSRSRATRWSRSTSARVLDGYCSDCTRTWATGELPDDLAEAYALVLRAQVAALDAVRPGPQGREIDAVARDIIDAAGHGEHFGHGLGHGVGLEVHEAPRLARTGDDAAGRRATS